MGTAWQALLNYSLARKNRGAFVLRIEDTDQARSTAASEAAILRALRWLGLEWDEGPDVGGAFGPYRQSERTPQYREVAERLLDEGYAYRDRAPGASGYAIRLRTPEDGRIALTDQLRPGLSRDWASVDDPVLLKSDGFPTYHLAHVVDDKLMGITDVIRGEEWIASLPKHLLLHEVLGWTPPRFWHVPLLRNKDRNRSKLSKRKSPTSVDFYREAGFLPEALLNFLGMLIHTRAEGEEKFDLDSFVEEFDLSSLSLAGPVFDTDKLAWLNGRYIREDHTPEALVARLRDWRFDDRTLARIAELARPRMRTLGDFGFLASFFFADEVPLDPAALAGGRPPAEVAEWLLLAEWTIGDLPGFTEDAVRDAFRELAGRLGVSLGKLTRPLYRALTGAASSTPLFGSMVVLGSGMTRMRLRRARAALGDVPRRREKELESLRARPGSPASTEGVQRGPGGLPPRNPGRGQGGSSPSASAGEAPPATEGAPPGPGDPSPGSG